VRVRDTGIGMTPEELARAFDPFSQAEPSTHRTYGGTGLGLAIVHRLMEQMGGRIDIESERGMGTTVALHVPIDATG
jgi:signal transduction histidine kinase